MSLEHLHSIELKHAGEKADVSCVEGTVIQKGGRHYNVSNRYLVPRYTRENGEPLDRRSEELLTDRRSKFFQLAEDSIEVVWDREGIEAQKHRYEHTKDADEKQAHAALLVGAIVNRMERLGRVYLQRGSLIGTQFDLSEKQQQAISSLTADDSDDVVAAKLQPLLEEFSKLYIYLTFDAPLGCPEVMHSVRLSGRVPDRDGLLLDLVREMGKAMNLGSRANEKQTYQHIVTKIGLAMEGIDQIHGQMERLLRIDGILPMLSAATTKLAGEEASYLNLLGEYTQLARARAGIKTEDCKNYAPLYARMMGLEQKLHNIHEEMRQHAREGADVTAQEVRQLLDKGVRLMMVSSIARTPLNEHSPVAGGLERADKKAKRAASSIGQLQAAVAKVIDSAKSSRKSPSPHPHLSAAAAPAYLRG